jgi:hypothetical protein
MFNAAADTGEQQTTSHRAVVPFYAYAALSLLVACLLLFLHNGIFRQHPFHPHTLAITHLMALGWGTMMILGSSYQLLPVLLEAKLSSEGMARLSFAFAAIGIPLLVYAFYSFHTGWPMQTGAVLVNLAVVCFLANVGTSIWEKGKADVHSVFMALAATWLFSTTLFGLLLVFNFSRPLLPSDSVSYLSLHAHMGIVGWFLLLIVGVGSRLIPMFMISKYTSNKTLWWICGLINVGLITFVLLKVYAAESLYYVVPVLLVAAALSLFGIFCFKAWASRIRKKVDDQLKISLLSIALTVLPMIAILLVLGLKRQAGDIAVLYGFTIFFGWITAMILGMTFKTLPFIIWNKVYHHNSGKTPAPKDLFSESLFRWMSVVYLPGYMMVIAAVLLDVAWLLKVGTLCLLIAAVLYVCNVFLTLGHRPRT